MYGEDRRGRVVRDAIRAFLPVLVPVLSGLAISGVIFSLYGGPVEAFCYAAVMNLVILTMTFAARLAAAGNKAAGRRRVLASDPADWIISGDEEAAMSLEEEDHQRMIGILWKKLQEVQREADARQEDMLDYYTTWVHQIKTPIAVMKLQLAGEDSAENRALVNELFRIEQYVDMVLQYIRLDSDTNDLVIREYALDDLIRESVRKYAPQFIQRKLRLVYEPTDKTIVTDRKWFVSILDQLLSNAVKYTPAGSITIAVTEEGDLSITDTGIGIAPEDLPRIFEKGYTGNNGRYAKGPEGSSGTPMPQSSGLGLYLCRKAADLLRIPIEAESTPGVGTTFLLKC